MQFSIPFLLESCIAESSFLSSFFAQKGIKEQCAEPVTGSSRIEAWGVKKRETKSQLVPLEVTITPPVPRFIWSKICLFI